MHRGGDQPGKMFERIYPDNQFTVNNVTITVYFDPLGTSIPQTTETGPVISSVTSQDSSKAEDAGGQ